MFDKSWLDNHYSTPTIQTVFLSNRVAGSDALLSFLGLWRQYTVKAIDADTWAGHFCKTVCSIEQNRSNFRCRSLQPKKLLAFRSDWSYVWSQLIIVMPLLQHQCTRKLLRGSIPKQPKPDYAIHHTESNAPDPFRPPMVKDSRPWHRWAGRLPL